MVRFALRCRYRRQRSASAIAGCARRHRVAAVADAYGCGGYCSAAVGSYQGYKSGGLTGAIVGGIQGYVGYQINVNYPLGDGAGNILWGNVARGAAINGAFGCASASAAGGDCGRGALNGAAGTVGAAYGFVGAVIAGCAAGKIGRGSCGEGALNAVGAYAVYSAVGYIARSSASGSNEQTRARISPTVASGMKQAWMDSQASDPILRHEEGAYIVLNVNNSEDVVRWRARGSASITPTPRADDGTINGLRVLGEFHTHPNPPIDERGKT